jgi:hypothetical protein
MSGSWPDDVAGMPTAAVRGASAIRAPPKGLQSERPFVISETLAQVDRARGAALFDDNERLRTSGCHPGLVEMREAVLRAASIRARPEAN